MLFSYKCPLSLMHTRPNKQYATFVHTMHKIINVAVNISFHRNVIYLHTAQPYRSWGITV